MGTRYHEAANACRYWQECQIVSTNLLGEADRQIRELQTRTPAPPQPPRPVMSSTACQTPIKVETEEAVRPQVNTPAPPNTVTITAQEHLVYKGAVNNVRRLINAQANTKQELKEAKAGGSQEVIQALI